MSYQVLARKWRPQGFADMVGQAHVITALSNALSQQRLHHAYLFTGTRGVGKTTVARILAKSLNCEKGITPTPCNECDQCIAITGGYAPDLIEVDAASRTKVEDTRQLLDNIPYAPTQARFKIYLIDEVHMLSSHSFNALLKTLEEPPEHVKFLLATTDPQKLPITVLSRCLQFHLKHLPASTISAHLKNVLEKEKITFEEPALGLLAQAATGSVRDALSLLDQAIAFGNNNITKPDVEQMLGHVGSTALFALIDALQAQDGTALLNATQALLEDGADLTHTLDALLQTLQDIALLQAVPETNVELGETPAKLTPYAQSLTPENVQLYYQIALTGRRDLPLAPTPDIGFRMLMLRMLTFTPNAVRTPVQTQASERPASSEAPQPAIAAPAPSTQPSTSGDTWTDLIARANLKGMTRALAQNCELSKREGSHLHLTLNHQHAAMGSDKLKQQLQSALSQALADDIKLTLTIGEADTTPAQQQQQHAYEKKVAAEQALGNNSNLQSVLNAFETKIDPNSIQSKTE